MQHLRVENFESELAGLLEVWKHLSELLFMKWHLCIFLFCCQGLELKLKIGHRRGWVCNKTPPALSEQDEIDALSSLAKTGHCLNIRLLFTHSHKTVCLFLFDKNIILLKIVFENSYFITLMNESCLQIYFCDKIFLKCFLK